MFIWISHKELKDLCRNNCDRDIRNGENNFDIFKIYENVMYIFNIVKENGEEYIESTLSYFISWCENENMTIF